MFLRRSRAAVFPTAVRGVRTCYAPPARDMRFAFNEVLNAQKHFAKVPGGSEASSDVVDGVIDGMGSFASQVLAPLNSVGDDEGCKWKDGKVTTPTGFKEAYKQYCDAGWQGLSVPSEYGGQGLPPSVNILKSELCASANWSWGMFPGLSQGCINTLLLHGTEEIKNTYLPKLAEGIWTGTMCLTEPQCGSDLAQVKTKAEPTGDGKYKITGTKMFISCGEHDMAENIVHIVLARLPGAPEGTKGISLFLVPKFLPDKDGNFTQPNFVTCGSIEHKMGIHGSPTCVMYFDNSVGYLVGTPNRGLNHMFTFINTSRIGCALQGVATADRSFQYALAYAKERRAMRPPSGAKEPGKVADRIIVHPDVRRMLLTQKALAEGGRVMLYHCALWQDFLMQAGDDKQAKKADDHLGFLTPILKGFLTEMGNEAANHGIQVFGGHGYVKQNKVEQLARDMRIAALYEGTTGIQALDLLGRKIILHSKMKAINRFTKQVIGDCIRIVRTSANTKRVLPFAWRIAKFQAKWWSLTWYIALSAGLKKNNKDFIGSASVDYLMFSGYVTMGYYWLQMYDVALKGLKKNPEEKEFYLAKLQTAEFYFNNLLPRALGHHAACTSDPKNVMQMKEENFSLAY